MRKQKKSEKIRVTLFGKNGNIENISEVSTQLTNSGSYFQALTRKTLKQFMDKMESIDGKIEIHPIK